MKDRVFLDTNIWVYCFDITDSRKQMRALSLVSKSLNSQTGVISWQVVQEFYHVALHKFKRPLPMDVLENFTQQFLMPMCLIFPTQAVWREALLIHQQTQYRFYDSLIVSAALAAEAEILFSEDLQANRKIQGLEIRNPFT